MMPIQSEVHSTGDWAPGRYEKALIQGQGEIITYIPYHVYHKPPNSNTITCAIEENEEEICKVVCKQKEKEEEEEDETRQTDRYLIFLINFNAQSATEVIFILSGR